MLGLIAGLVMFTIPGFLLLDYLKFKDANKLLLGSILSFGITGSLFYNLSLLISVTPIMIAAYSLILLYFAYLKRNSLKEEIYNLLKTDVLKSGWNKVWFFVLVFCFALVGLHLLFTPIVGWDDSAYHVPLINDFAENGQFNKYSEPKNDFEIRSNRYPLLFEATVGLAKMTSGIEYWKLAPLMILVFAAYIIFLISRKNGIPTLLGSVFFVSTLWVIKYAADFNVDIYISVVLAIAIYFLIEYFEEKRQAYLFISGFFLGLGVLTKFTGIIFLILIIGCVLIKKRDFVQTFKFAIFSLMVTVPYFLIQALYFGADDRVGVVMQGGFLTQNIFSVFTRNVFDIFHILFEFNFKGYFLPIVFLFFTLFLIINKKNEMVFLNQLILMLFFGFISAMSLTAIVNSGYGIPRFLFLAYLLMCVAAGLFVENLKTQKIRNIVKIYSLIVIIICALPIFVDYSNKIINLQRNEYRFIQNNIPNEPGVKIYFPTSNAHVLGLENSDLRDLSSYNEINMGVCEFLKEERINYIVFSSFNDWERLPRIAGQEEFKNSDWINRLVEEINTGKCTEVFSNKDPRNLLVLKVKSD